MDHVARVAMRVCDLRAVPGQQVEQFVLPRVAGVEAERRDELCQPPLVLALRVEGAQCAPDVDAAVPLRRPVVERGAHRRPVAAREVRQALVAQQVHPTVALGEAEPPRGDADRR